LLVERRNKKLIGISNADSQACHFDLCLVSHRIWSKSSCDLLPISSDRVHYKYRNGVPFYNYISLFFYESTRALLAAVCLFDVSLPLFFYY